ncbi:MAG: hypothetical protein AB9903_34325 [Vulcanimicrobiota bacterium]
MVCERVRKSRTAGKKRSVTFQAFPDLVKKILEKSEQSGVTPGKWIEKFLTDSLK